MSDVVLLKDLLEIKNGRDYKHLNKGSVPVYGTGGIITYVDSYLYKGESILLPRKGTLDNICELLLKNGVNKNDIIPITLGITKESYASGVDYYDVRDI